MTSGACSPNPATTPSLDHRGAPADPPAPGGPSTVSPADDETAPDVTAWPGLVFTAREADGAASDNSSAVAADGAPKVSDGDEASDGDHGPSADAETAAPSDGEDAPDAPVAVLTDDEMAELDLEFLLDDQRPPSDDATPLESDPEALAELGDVAGDLGGLDDEIGDEGDWSLFASGDDDKS